ncbi:hypothetical protein CapIbe_019972 [Capra ibex]
MVKCLWKELSETSGLCTINLENSNPGSSLLETMEVTKWSSCPALGTGMSVVFLLWLFHSWILGSEIIASPSDGLD